MDVDVETDLLYSLMDGLSKSSQVLMDASSDMSSYTDVASATLSGNQYSMSIEETSRICCSVGEAVDNMNALSRYVSKLAQHIEKYLQCKFEG